MNSELLPPALSELLAIRISVAYLGEGKQFGWWPTSFFAFTSKTFLDPIFPKTMQLAQYHGVVEAAARQHDEHLSTSSYHLFRLPEEIEAELCNAVRTMDAAQFSPNDQSTSLDRLRMLAKTEIDCADGPVAVGNISEIFEPTVINALASAYFAAFSSDTRAYPYLVRQ